VGTNENEYAGVTQIILFISSQQVSAQEGHQLILEEVHQS
jgi:hypothetical protein